MTPLDILVLALPADRARADLILDGLHEAKVAGVQPTRIETVDPQSPDWPRIAELARAARCVLFCWSAATATPAAAPLRVLAAELRAQGTALSIELDRASNPAEMAGVSTYPAYGWRCRPGMVLRFLFGDIHRAQIAVAAQRKVSGQDPPPPAAFWQLLRGRAWVALVGLFALIGTASTLWQLWNDGDLARLLDPAGGAAFAKARDARDCAAMRAFVKAHADSGWADKADEFLNKCQVRLEPVPRDKVQPLPFYATSRADAQEQAAALCKRAPGTLVRLRITRFVPNAMGWVECTTKVIIQVPQERYIG